MGHCVLLRATLLSTSSVLLTLSKWASACVCVCVQVCVWTTGRQDREEKCRAHWCPWILTHTAISELDTHTHTVLDVKVEGPTCITKQSTIQIKYLLPYWNTFLLCTNSQKQTNKKTHYHIERCVNLPMLGSILLPSGRCGTLQKLLLLHVLLHLTSKAISTVQMDKDEW